jgi:hypothetical protein
MRDKAAGGDERMQSEIARSVSIWKACGLAGRAITCRSKNKRTGFPRSCLFFTSEGYGNGHILAPICRAETGGKKSHERLSLP